MARRLQFNRKSKKGNNIKTKYYPTKGVAGKKKTLISYSTSNGMRHMVVTKTTKVFKTRSQANKALNSKRAS